MRKAKKSTNKTPYAKHFAGFYDTLMNKTRYREWQELVEEKVKKYDIKKGRALDLACGTGTMSQVLYDLGFKTTGVDISPDMIKIARNKHKNISFKLQDICNLNLSDKFDFATCFYDATNYITTDKRMGSMFKRIAKHLKSDGIFLFDINTNDHIKVAQNFNPTIYNMPDGSVVIFRHGGKNRVWQINVDMFIKQQANSYIKSSEIHLEKGYSEKDIRNLIKQTSLKILEMQKETKSINGKKYLSRLYFIVQKS